MYEIAKDTVLIGLILLHYSKIAQLNEVAIEKIVSKTNAALENLCSNVLTQCYILLVNFVFWAARPVIGNL